MRNPALTRNLIISKAISIFNTKGYRATSLSDITKATGITKGAIYGNFENKDDMALAAFEYGVTIIMEHLREVIKLSPTAPLKLKGIVHYYAKYVQEPPIDGGCPLINTSIEADDDHPKLRAKVIRTIAIIKDSIIKIIHRGILEGQITPSLKVEEFATLFFATLKGGVVISRIEGDNESFKAIKNQLFEKIDSFTIN